MHSDITRRKKATFNFLNPEVESSSSCALLSFLYATPLPLIDSNKRAALVSAAPGFPAAPGGTVLAVPDRGDLDLK